MTERHPLLERQVRRYLAAELAVHGGLERFLEAVGEAYASADEERALLERALDLSSEELNESNAELRSILQALPDRVVLIDPEGRVGAIKSPSLAGTGLDLGANVASSVIAGPDLDAALASARRGEAAEPFELRQRVPDAEDRAFVVHVRPTGQGHALIVVRDSTAELRAQRAQADASAALEAARLKSEFLATMSHEIRSPMNAVIGMTSLLTGTGLDDQQAEFVETIRASGDALLTLINDILDFSKIEAGRLDLEHVPVALDTIAEDVVELLAEKAQGRSIELEALIDLPLGMRVMGDPTRLRQVLVNLVDNAVKFTRSGHVALRLVVTEDGGVRAAIEDTGIGIPAEAIGRIQEPFSQADGSTTRHFGGTGLGLSICRRLVELMNGTLSIESEVGAGSCFSFELPAATSPDASMDVASAPEGEKRDVIVGVERPLRRAAVVKRLHRLGYTPEVVPPARLADALARASSLAGIVVDASEPATPLEAVVAAAEERTGAPIQVLALVPPGTPAPALESPTLRVARSPLRTRGLAMILAGSKTSRPRQVAEPGRGLEEISALLVEDNPVNQLVARRMLERLEVQHELASDGEAALAALDARSFDVILMDCQMPIMDGFEATRAIRARERGTGEHAWIVALTANAMLGDRERCLDAGMDDYLPKPVAFPQLEALLRRIAQVKRRASA